MQTSPEPAPRHRRATTLWISLALIGLTAGVYAPVRHYPFLEIDDPIYVTHDPFVTAGLTVPGTIRAFTTVQKGGWYPLTAVSHMLDCQLFGLDPGAHHLTNLALHIVNTLLLLLVLAQMTGEVWRSAFVAAVFAVHPLHVESVAWISERKDVLSGFFWMLTLSSYYRFTLRPSLPRYGLVLLAFTLGLLSKVSLVTFPFTLLLLDFWPLGRMRFAGAPRVATAPIGQKPFFGLLLEKVPLLLLSGGVGLVGVTSQWHGTGRFDAPFLFRFMTTFVIYGTYISKTFWPRHHLLLSLFNMSPPIWQVAGGAVVLGGISLFAVREVRRYPYLLVGWLWFLVMLASLSGLIGVGDIMIGDRHMYVPVIGLAIIVAWGIPDLLKPCRYGKAGCATLAILAVAGCAILASRQLWVWRDTMSLLEYQLELQPDNYIANFTIGWELFEDGRLDEAVPYLSEALRVQPGHAKANYYMGRLLAKQGDLDAARQHYVAALQSDPGYAQAHVGLGLVLAAQGDADGALAQYREAIRLDPDVPFAQTNLAVALEDQGQRDEALEHYTEAVRLEPQRAQWRCNLAAALASAGRGREAVEQFRAAVQLNPQLAEAHFGLATIYAQAGQSQAAITELDSALRQRPDWSAAEATLAWLLATADDAAVRDGPRAVQLAEDAAQRTGHRDPEVLNSLAAAYAEVGRFAEATEFGKQALALAQASNRTALASALADHLAQYGAGQPLREPSRSRNQ